MELRHGRPGSAGGRPGGDPARVPACPVRGRRVAGDHRALAVSDGATPSAEPAARPRSRRGTRPAAGRGGPDVRRAEPALVLQEVERHADGTRLVLDRARPGHCWGRRRSQSRGVVMTSLRIDELVDARHGTVDRRIFWDEEIYRLELARI